MNPLQNNLTLRQKIEKCRNSRMAGKRAINPPQLCRSDWCTHCSRGKTRDMLRETLRVLDSSPDYTLITILLGAVTSYKQALNMAKDAVAKLAKVGITGLGSMEIGNRKDSKGFDNFNQVFPIDETRDEGIAHLHFISPQYYAILKKMFPISRQVHQDKLGVKPAYKDLSYNENISRTVSYCRKKKDAYNAWWFSQVSGDQYVYRMLKGVVSVLANGLWSVSGSGVKRGVSEGCGDGFVDVSGVFGCVNGGQLSHTTGDENTIPETRSLKPETIKAETMSPRQQEINAILVRMREQSTAKREQERRDAPPPVNPDKYAETRDALFKIS